MGGRYLPGDRLAMAAQRQRDERERNAAAVDSLDLAAMLACIPAGLFGSDAAIYMLLGDIGGAVLMLKLSLAASGIAMALHLVGRYRRGHDRRRRDRLDAAGDLRDRTDRGSKAFVPTPSGVDRPRSVPVAPTVIPPR